jgi:glycosyltransferase involved in cell wall biosynthesis
VKVTLVTDWFLPRLGGLELHVRDLAGALAARGHEVDVVTTTPADPSRQGRLQVDPLPEPRGVRVHRLPLFLLPGAGLTVSLRAVPVAGAILDRIGPDVVHVHAGLVPPLPLAAGYAAHRRGLPLVATFHSVLGRFRPLWALSDRLLGWAAWADVLTAVGPDLAREVGEVVGHGPLPVLPNGIATAEWAAPPAGPDPAPRGELRLVSVMRLQRRKRGRALIEALAEAAGRLDGERRLTLTVVGDGPRRRALEVRARALGVANRVRFEGYLPRREIRERLASADVFVLPSVRESFGLSALEARAAGLAVVARRDSGVGAILGEGPGTLLVEDDAGMADALVRLAGRPELLEAMRGHGRETPSPYEWESVVARHREIYERARRSRRPAPSVATGRPGSNPDGLRERSSRPGGVQGAEEASLPPVPEETDHLSQRLDGGRTRVEPAVPPDGRPPEVHQLPRMDEEDHGWAQPQEQPVADQGRESEDR